MHPKRSTKRVEHLIRKAKTAYDAYFLEGKRDEVSRARKMEDERSKRLLINTLVVMLNDRDRELDRLRGLHRSGAVPKRRVKKVKKTTHEVCEKWCPLEGCKLGHPLLNTKNYSTHLISCQKRLDKKNNACKKRLDKKKN